MIIRPLMQSDIMGFYGHTFQYSIKGIAAVIDDEVVGIAGIMYTNPLQCFSSFNDEAVKTHKRDIVRGIRLLRIFLNQCTTPVYALPDKNEKTARSFLEHVGFTQIENEVFVWQTQ